MKTKIEPCLGIARSRGRAVMIELLELALTGAPRPSKNSHELGGKLVRYTSPKYPEFRAQLKQIRPDWFEEIDSAAIKKLEILKLARNGEDRPSPGSSLGLAIQDYLSRSKRSYDQKFREELHMLRPDWFLKNNKRINKERIIELAKSGSEKPKRGTNLGNVLSNYTKKGKDYEPEFRNRLEQIRPDWFSHKIDPSGNKEKILKIALSGGPRPFHKSKLGMVFQFYIRDEAFKAELESIVPEWFIDSAALNKGRFLEDAKMGKPRPHWNTKDGKLLHNYKADKVFIEKLYKANRYWKPTKGSNGRKNELFTNNNCEVVEIKKGAMDKVFYIYEHYFPETNEIFYVGKGRDRREATKNRGSAWLKRVSENKGVYKIRRIREDLTEGEAFAIEEEIIFHYRDELGYDLCNLTRGGDGVSGRKSHKVLARKARFLEDARAGKPRPKYGSKDYSYLVSYTRPTSIIYDEAFMDELYKINPSWKPQDRASLAAAKKARLIEQARLGKPKPKRNTTEGGVLKDYLSRDIDFSRKIMEINPDWMPKSGKSKVK